MTITDLLTRRDILVTIKKHDVCLDPDCLGGTRPLSWSIKDSEAPYILVKYYNECPLDVFARLYNEGLEAYFVDECLNDNWLEIKEHLCKQSTYSQGATSS